VANRLGSGYRSGGEWGRSRMGILDEGGGKGQFWGKYGVWVATRLFPNYFGISCFTVLTVTFLAMLRTLSENPSYFANNNSLQNFTVFRLVSLRAWRQNERRTFFLEFCHS